ncbi:1,2-phenylacetyl-CoA epoxidase subunit PaaD [Croceimicrobium hydrocarbonivorans]|uniref:Phenylacetate-CoA oxygenase subunit PaaJ n=1 Tax=Croceimicrobium hydrocarbonivorans TaxID=2761580 RepID=A0A7H0VJ96_9FLAO|nr:1,2-phenylacetyl-CoA epoxidase subunit PaaD [Croceimicrobium hydrocarbonivorans]QNR25794.1 phenylacetate-CoA oxygenase subunit PaaJ [Croceimicrobium hydrocarbonivorans]
MTEAIWKILKNVADPEIPVLTVVDMGVVREVEVEDQKVIVSITPTYSGCPAMNEIESNIQWALEEAGYNEVEIKTLISPPWTTDWMTDEGKAKLQEYGIAPPEGSSADKSVLFGEAKKVMCPRCKSRNTTMVSQFGSTACKALYKCEDCKEPFDYFKCL